jgi:hypothetical protein
MFPDDSPGGFFACSACTMSSHQRPNRVETAIGWSLAACVHPIAAWRMSSPRRRLLIVTAYFAAAYASALAAMLLLAPGIPR